MTGEYTYATNIDKLVSLEMAVRGLHDGESQQSVIEELYVAAREAKGEPICASAARDLHEQVSKGDTVLIATGAGGPPWLPKGETDGPPGAAGLGYAIAVGLGGRPVFITEEERSDIDVEPIEACTHAIGLNVVPYNELLERSTAASIVTFPEDGGRAEADELISEFDPAAVIAIEKLGPNKNGITHSSTGRELVDHGGIAPLFDSAIDKGILTIGIGDNGNEIGFGRIEDSVREIHPWGDVSQDPPDGGGITSRIATDHIVVSGTSNWGAYGIEAMIAILSETPDALHSPDDESRMLDHSIAVGCSDGVYSQPLMMVDGMTEGTQRSILTMLNDLVDHALADPYEREY